MKISTPVLKTFAAGLFAVVLALQSGCVLVAAGAAAGAGTVAYVRGELDATVSKSYENAVQASGRAIDQLQFAKISEQKDALSAKFTARTAQDKKVTIIVSKVSDTLTRVQIRVGVF